ncbi:hypothetical protein PN462_23205 [Spirulina sp. CS-785/01]|uniref:hypothetical protein n=1 Tax=Spirulina sp. CS-785/01 TaxID=3021716 RepID=UPI00232E358B|nr:hypothetical protein [Spirulina sp. CS-785/01]MDB9316038.1 hypothetical protein [Spirulina sp. CS-785/01]
MKQLSLFPEINQLDENSYYSIQGNIPLNIPNNSLLSIQRETPLKIYSIGFQPAKSIPEIPRWFLQKYGSSQFTVLEPFAGSGTTLLECLQFGATVHWTDYNPLSRLICHVKTQNVDIFELYRVGSKIVETAHKQENVPETVNFQNKNFWFQSAVQEGLEILKEQINNSLSHLRPYFKLAFATTVRKMSDMNDGMILAAKRPHIETIPQRSRTDVFYAFQCALDQLTDAVKQWQLYHKKPQLAQQLSVNNAKEIQGNHSFDAVLTSPPYINAIDYVWASKFELHWLNLVENDKARLELYSQEIGTERIPKKEYQHLGKTGNKKLDQLIEDIYHARKYQASKGQNQLRARVVYRYFNDLKKHFTHCLNMLKNDGYYCFAVGEISTICGVQIPVANLLKEIALEVGFREEFCFHILLKNRKLNVPRNVDWAKTIKHDTVIVLKK